MRGGSSFRRAVAGSVGLHALLAVVLVVAARWHARRPDPPPARPGIDTRVDLRIEVPADEPSVPVEPSAAPAPPSDPPSPKPEPEPPMSSRPPTTEPVPAPPVDPSEGSRPPLARTPAVPQTLPPGLLTLLKKPPAPAPEVTEVPVTPTPLYSQSAPGPSPAVVPAAAQTPSPTRPSAEARFDGGLPVHGPLGAGRTIVYVLDASGSMGEWGKFDAARRALIATLRKQPETVRFQVVVYEGFAYLPLRAPAQGCVAATAENVDRMTAVIRSLKDPRGRSNHVEGLRTALDLRPDFVLILTDADDLPTAPFRGLLRQASRPAVLCVAKVGAGGVGGPVEVR